MCIIILSRLLCLSWSKRDVREIVHTKRELCDVMETSPHLDMQISQVELNKSSQELEQELNPNYYMMRSKLPLLKISFY